MQRQEDSEMTCGSVSSYNRFTEGEESSKTIIDSEKFGFAKEIVRNAPWKEFTSRFLLVPNSDSNDPNAWRSMTIDFRVNVNNHRGTDGSNVETRMALSFIMN